ncbi:MAG TPA: bifunctional UDP-N-acetylglucosamine diphosphorylase/glucosamine-1-phosphate N-acetyltransferase GlmU [Candidatus Limnocylindrales bacterium]|nr:bifunctional UDP-N-acetylglucosamine diphosphorylase/glucosamine-1-phosphate N-acetyltransferase GlmU [Candidatus Limnocylindrales bacterium]
MSPAGSTVRAVVMAAGLGTRMRSRRPKVLHELCGRPMLAYVLDAAAGLGAGEAQGPPARPLVVVSPVTAAVRERFAAEADFAEQAEPRGTGDAVRAALDALAGTGDALSATIVVLSGDAPLLTSAAVAELADAHAAAGAAMTLTVFHPPDPHGYGRVVQDAGGVTRIVEEQDGGHLLDGLGDLNGGLYAFDTRWLQGRIGALTPSPASGELYLTELVALARADGRPVAVYELDDWLELAAINDRLQLAFVEAEMRRRILARHMLAGVTVVDPATAYVEAGVELAPDVVLEPNVSLRGRTRVGEGSIIGSGCQIFDSVVGSGCRIWASLLESAEVEDGVQIGPLSHLRPGASIGAGARIGNFAEVKNSRLGPGVQQHHFSYLGDADVGERTNVGAGTITANYDGVRKNRTTIGRHVSLGVDTMLRAPITIGDDAVTGAGAVVTHDVPPGKLAVGVPARIRTPHAPKTVGLDDPPSEPPAEAAGSS